MSLRKRQHISVLLSKQDVLTFCDKNLLPEMHSFVILDDFYHQYLQEHKISISRVRFYLWLRERIKEVDAFSHFRIERHSIGAVLVNARYNPVLLNNRSSIAETQNDLNSNHTNLEKVEEN